MLVKKYCNETSEIFKSQLKIKEDKIFINLTYLQNDSKLKFNDIKIITIKNINFYKIQIALRKKLYISKDKCLYFFKNKKILKMNLILDTILSYNQKYINIEYSLINSYGFN